MKGTEEGSIQVQYEGAQYNESNKNYYLGAYQDRISVKQKIVESNAWNQCSR